MENTDNRRESLNRAAPGSRTREDLIVGVLDSLYEAVSILGAKTLDGDSERDGEEYRQAMREAHEALRHIRSGAGL